MQIHVYIVRQIKTYTYIVMDIAVHRDVHRNMFKPKLNAVGQGDGIIVS